MCHHFQVSTKLWRMYKFVLPLLLTTGQVHILEVKQGFGLRLNGAQSVEPKSMPLAWNQYLWWPFWPKLAHSVSHKWNENSIGILKACCLHQDPVSINKGWGGEKPTPACSGNPSSSDNSTSCSGTGEGGCCLPTSRCFHLLHIQVCFLFLLHSGPCTVGFGAVVGALGLFAWF